MLPRLKRVALALSTYKKYVASQNPFRAHIYILRKLKVDLLPIRFQGSRAMTYPSWPPCGAAVPAHDSFIEVVQEAVDRTGMDQVPITDRTRLLSDNGPGYVSRAFRDYLGVVGIRHILAAPFHPQTNGKLERYHQTLKRDVNQLPYEMPSDLEAAIVAFVSYYNYRRYHKALGNVTPSNVLRGRREDILRRRREVKAQTIERRRRHNRALSELARPPSNP